jgi:Sec-independent protein secretion pathway component TatC
MSDEARMPFLSHLEELRKRLIICFSVIGVAFVLAFNIREYCIRLLQWPLATEIVMRLNRDGFNFEEPDWEKYQANPHTTFRSFCSMLDGRLGDRRIIVMLDEFGVFHLVCLYLIEEFTVYL